MKSVPTILMVALLAGTPEPGLASDMLETITEERKRQRRLKAEREMREAEALRKAREEEARRKESEAPSPAGQSAPPAKP
jgi:hypothetical protein